MFGIYGTTYGAGDGSTTFKLPDFRNRAIWGGDTAGYLAAGLPNITGKIDGSAQTANHQIFGETSGTSLTINGAFSGIYGNQYPCAEPSSTSTYELLRGFNFNASNSNLLYGKSSTVQPPSIKVRVYTRYQ